MKKTLILIATLAILSSCKKTYNYSDHPDNGNKTDVSVGNGEDTNVSADYIKTHQFTIVASYSYNENNVRIWKLKSENKVVIIDNVPPELFWKTGFQVGDKVDSSLIVKLLNKL